MAVSAGYGKGAPQIEKILEKAVLCVYDVRETKDGKGKTDGSYVQAAAAALEAAFRDKGRTGLEGTAVKQNYKIFQVQFNPNELELSSLAVRSAQETGNPEITVWNSITKHTVNLPLIFEDIEEPDAFVWDRQQTLFQKSYTPESVSKAVRGSRRECSVKWQVEGLLSLLSHETTRNVVFCWGSISLAGVLESAQAEYTMFNSYGNPIMARMTLRILLNYGRNDSNEQYWKKAFQNMLEIKHSRMGESVADMAGTISAMTRF